MTPGHYPPFAPLEPPSTIWSGGGWDYSGPVGGGAGRSRRNEDGEGTNGIPDLFIYQDSD